MANGARRIPVDSSALKKLLGTPGNHPTFSRFKTVSLGKVVGEAILKQVRCKMSMIKSTVRYLKLLF